MDACARIRGVPLKTRSSIRKETIQDSSALSLKTLLKSRKELCNMVLEFPLRDPLCMTEMHFVCLPSHSDGDSFTLQAQAAATDDVMELLRSLHVHSLRDEEVLLLKDSKNLLEKKDSFQTSMLKAICILRHSQTCQSSVSATLGLLARYTVGVRFALELQSVQRGTSNACQTKDDDTNQSVSSIEDDFVTALEHLEEDGTTDYPPSGPYSQQNRRDVASQTVPSRRKDKSGSRVIIRSLSKKASAKKASPPEISVSVQSSAAAWPYGPGSQWSVYASGSPPEKGRITATSLTESDESNCSSPSPIIFLDEVGYQKSLKAKLNIPKIPILKDGVEDSDSEVSEFFDSFDQFDDLGQTLELLKEPTSASQTQKKKPSEDRGSKYVSRGSSAKAMNLQRFDHPTLPANIRKPTPLKPGAACAGHSEVPDSPRQVMASGEDSGALFSPVRSSAFSPLADGGTVEYFWKADGDASELRKPQDLCTLYKTYSDFASCMSKDILASVCGYSAPVDMNVNKNLSCVCHKEFQNVSGHLMKLTDIQEAVTISKSQTSQTLTDGIQKFATDLVEMSIGSAFRDLQKGVTSCTTTLCHLAARLTSSVFQMAFQEIGMRHAYVLKERAVNGLAGFLVGEAMSEALKEFRFVRKQIFNNTVSRFAADLAEELVFEGIMEVCQFSHPSTPSTSSDWSFQQEEEVVSSYASDLSESVLQEAFIELSQAEVTFTTQAAISLSLDNIHYVSTEDSTPTTMTCDVAANYFGSPCASELPSTSENQCTMRKALYCMSGIASCVPVPAAGEGISQFQNLADILYFRSARFGTGRAGWQEDACSRRGAQQHREEMERNPRHAPILPQQQPPPESQEKQIKQFSKKLKGKLAKEFSPATPPSTPQYQPSSGSLEAGADSEKKDFMLKLMRSLSEEAGSNENEEEDGGDDGCQSGMQAGDWQLPVETDNKTMQKGALRYAERLAYHIVSMATEMDTLGLEEGRKFSDKESKANPLVRSAQFSEETLNSLWMYAGEIAGEVINDVKKMMVSTRCRRRASRGGGCESAECPSHTDHGECKLSNMADQWSSDLVTSVLSLQSSGSSGLSSKFPSCESVTDEYAGYLIRVLKREGGSRELILDHYASRLAYRSIKSGLAQAARKIKLKSNLRLHSFRRLHQDGSHEVWKRLALETPSIDTSVTVSSNSEADQCTCQKTGEVSSGEYMELVSFAESLAYNITSNVTRKLRLSSVRLPKSLTDSCLYKKAKLGDVPDRLIRTSCSCSLLPYSEKHKQYHSTGSLNDGNHSDGVMQVIERYARKIVDDTLEVTLATAGHLAVEDRMSLDQNLYTERLALGSALAEKACHYCAVKNSQFGSNIARQHFQEVHRKRERDGGALTDSRARAYGLEIPKIHIDLDKRAAFAEDMVSSAIEKAKRELSSTSLNADSGIGHDGASFAESLTTEIMASAMSNICQASNVSPPGRERINTSESTVSQQLSLSAGDDSIGSWSNLSFEDEQPDETSSFLHLSDSSNGNSSSWSSLGLEGEVCEEPLSLSPSDSNGTEDKEIETKEDPDGPPQGEVRPPPRERGLLVVSTDLREHTLDLQVSVALQWIAASHSNLPMMQLGQPAERELELLPAVLQKVKEKEWRVGDLLQALLRYCEEMEPEAERRCDQPFFQWLLEHV
ncbi:hypothetical protein AAFF_G00279320 [Aldrovandia affinis]|uniref:A-kinase anchor protein 11 n=1 Tax=Aldrovandia affinis TaxID=143900 RepID=A0AAD7SSF4_9TELE|nr:hypothetical protein AAFF_G00279320 [Aldrovandia affinis]